MGKKTELPRKVRGRTVEKTVKVALTNDELLDRGQKLAQSITAQHEAEADLASFKSEVKTRLDRCSAEQSKFQTAIKEKAEWRAMNCYEEFDYDAKTVSIVRPDTFENVEVREMTERELQRNLPGFEESGMEGAANG